MTDKQIIIDGVDVKKCKYFYRRTKECVNEDTIDALCEEFSNCYYKQLLRKEQECEELKAKCKKYGEINEQETKDYAELKKERDSYIDKYFLESQKVLKLNKVLKEIKEIAKKQCVCGIDCIDMKQILQKISECEGNDEN